MPIESYAFGNMTVDGEAFADDVTIVNGRARGGWWRGQGHLAREKDLEKLLAARPEVLVVGTGSSGGMKVDPAVSRACADQGIELIVEPTAKAAKTYNALAAQGKKVAAAFHLTC